MRHRWAFGLAVLLALAGPALAAPWTVRDDRGVAVTLSAPPQRIVTLLPSSTEAVCALGACGRLVGTDRFSNWPETVKALPKLGGLDDAQLEAIVALKPDLVLAAESTRALARLESLGLRVLALEPKTFADTGRVLEAIAAAIGQPGSGRTLWQQTEARIAGAAARVPSAWRGRIVYFEVATTPYAASESSFVGELLARLGLKAAVPGSLGPFPQLNPEFVVRAQPDVVMAGARDLAGMPARPGWSALRALREKRQCGFAPERMEVILRPGPRLGDAAGYVADCLAALEAGTR